MSHDINDSRMSVSKSFPVQGYVDKFVRRLRASAATAVLVFGGGACAAPQFFSLTSAWNVQIPSTATYSGVPAVPNFVAGLDTWDSSNTWTIPGFAATSADPLRPLLYNSSAWYKVYTGEWARWSNSRSVERAILASSSNWFPYPGNVFSSTSTSSWVLPASYNKTINPGNGPASFSLGASMSPAPGPDGHRFVAQPDGRIVETYGTIILSSGQVVALSYSVTDPSSRGDGWQNGKTASMLPIYAGQLYDDEIAKGITHAIAITVPAKLLAATITYPAYAFDRDAATAAPPFSGVIPMGGRLALPTAVAIASLGLKTPEGWAIARAAQRFGFIVVDRGGSGITLRVQPNARFRDKALHSWNSPLQDDLNAIMVKVEQVQFAITPIP
jgi:hypothetical protein